LAAIGLSTASAEIQSGELRINSIQGTVTCSTDHSAWFKAKPDLVLHSGAILKTGSGSCADLVLDYSGTVLHMAPDSLLELARLDKEMAGENVVIDTSLNLKSGSIVGSQRKLAKPSKFEITAPGVVATIRGTEYAVCAAGGVTCFSGAVSINYNSPNGSSVAAQVPAGCSFNPDSGKVLATTPACLTSYSHDIDAVRECAQQCKGACGPIEEPTCPISPHKPPPCKPPPPPPHHAGHGGDDGHGGNDR
jgi:hypothetical protein